MKNHLKPLALLVIVMMVFGLAACTTAAPTAAPTVAPTAAPTTAAATAAPTETPAPTATPIPAISHDALTITSFSETSNYAGDQPGWFAKILKDKFNLTVNIEAPQVGGGGDTVFATKLVSGDLGDYIVFGDNATHIQQAIDAGLLLDWNKNNLLANYGQDILKNYSTAIDYNKSQYGKGAAVYGIGNDLFNSNKGPSELVDFTWGPYVRWDLYAKLGYPQINDMEDYLTVLKDMQKLEPKTADGKKVYAFSFWKDWDGSHMMNAKQFACMYGFNDDTGGVVLVNYSEPTYQDLLQEDGYYLRTLKMYFDANQLGLVDPESPTQNWDTMFAKAQNGQFLFNWFSWLRPMNTTENKNAGKGMMPVPFKNEVMCSYGKNVYGANRITAIGVNCKNPDRVMELINWTCTPEGVMISSDGPEGLAWTKGTDGKAVLTDLGAKIRDSDTTTIPDEWGGGQFRDGVNKFAYQIVNRYSIDPTTNESYDWSGWASTLTNPALMTKLDMDWQAKMGAKSAVEWFTKNGKIAISVPTATKVDTTLPDDLKAKLDQIGAKIKDYSWKMVFAKNQAEFDSLKAEMITACKGLGYDDVKAANIKMAEQLFALRGK
jgi:putative aldouronate transport system substrate-binding protein